MNNVNPRVNAGKSQQYWTSKSGACETTQSKHLFFFFIVIKRTFFPLAKLAIAPKSNPHKTWVVLGDVFISRPMMQTVSLNPDFSHEPCADLRIVFLLPPPVFWSWRIFFNLLAWLTPPAARSTYCAVSFVGLSSAGRCTVNVQVTSVLADPLRRPLCRLLCTPLVGRTNNSRLLLICAFNMVHLYCFGAIFKKMSDLVKRIKSPFKSPPFLSFFWWLRHERSQLSSSTGPRPTTCNEGIKISLN